MRPMAPRRKTRLAKGLSQLSLLCVALLGMFLRVQAVSALGGWQCAAVIPLFPPPLISGRGHMDAEERLQHVKLRLQRTSASAVTWLVAKKEKILTEEEIYAEKVRRFARSIDQVLL